MKYLEILNDYLQKDNLKETERKRINKVIEQKENQIKRLQKKKERLGYVHWIDEILKPLAEELKTKIGKKHTDILGPFGITGHTSIWFYDTEEQRKECKVSS